MPPYKSKEHFSYRPDIDGLRVLSVIIVILFHFLNTDIGYRLSLESLRNFVLSLHLMGKKIIFVLNIPIGKELRPSNAIDRGNAFREIFFHSPLTEDKNSFIRVSDHLNYFKKIYEDLIKIASEVNGSIIDPVKYLCSEDKCCALTHEGATVYRDESHLASSYVKEHVSYIDQTIAI